MFVKFIDHRVVHLVAAVALWWLLSGHSDSLMLSLGLLSAVFSVCLAWRMLSVDREYHPFVVGRSLVTFWLWLARAIINANINVMRHVFRVPLQLSPTWIRIRTHPRTEVGMATLANSITLTPGTVSVDVDDDGIDVHALTRDAAEELQTGDMENRARDPGRVPLHA